MEYVEGLPSRCMICPHAATPPPTGYDLYEYESTEQNSSASRPGLTFPERCHYAVRAHSKLCLFCVHAY